MTHTYSHPGKILKEVFMRDAGVSASALARAIAVPTNRVSEICAGRANITADTAIRLGSYFGNDPQEWMYAQSQYGLSQARQKSAGQVQSGAHSL